IQGSPPDARHRREGGGRRRGAAARGPGCRRRDRPAAAVGVRFPPSRPCRGELAPRSPPLWTAAPLRPSLGARKGPGMLRYLLGRLVSLALSLVAASLVIFAVIEIVPGDPASYMLGLNASADTVAALRHRLGLNEALPLRYLHWIAGMATGDFGQSYTYKVPVADLVAQRLAVSLPLALYALLMAVLIAFPAGLLAAARRGRSADAAVMGATQIGIALPNFWFAMLLVLAFALHWQLFPAGGFPGWGDPLAGIRALTLPAVALALPQAAILARVLRSALIETLGQDYIRTARAKGLTVGQTMLRHA